VTVKRVPAGDVQIALPVAVGAPMAADAPDLVLSLKVPQLIVPLVFVSAYITHGWLVFRHIWPTNFKTR
jgi:hypothetical protein